MSDDDETSALTSPSRRSPRWSDAALNHLLIIEEELQMRVAWLAGEIAEDRHHRLNVMIEPCDVVAALQEIRSRCG